MCLDLQSPKSVKAENMSVSQPKQEKTALDGRSARKDANRKLVIDAAFRLFMSGGEDALTMRRLAAEAGVSDATPYNLFKNKTGVLVAMFEAFLNELPKPTGQNEGLDALQRFLLVTEHVAHLWSEPTGLFCGLMAAVQRSGEMPLELLERPRRGIGAAMERLKDEGWLQEAASPQIVADRIAHANGGLFGLWQSGRLSKKQLEDELKLNALLPILAVASDLRRKEVHARLDELCRPDETKL